MRERNRSIQWDEVLLTLCLTGGALAMAYQGSAHAALVLLASVIFFQVRHVHPTFFEKGKELVAAEEHQQVSRRVEQLLVDIKTTLEDMKTEIDDVKTTVDDVKTKLEDEDDS